jgi:type III pantothenate kinase
LKSLVIDIGNSQVKTAVFEGDRLLESTPVITTLLQELSRIKTIHGEPGRCLLSSVTADTGELLLLQQLFPNCKIVTLRSGLKLPVKVLYKTAGTLGSDRLANACGAWKFNQGKNTLVIDCGTCIKYDYVSADHSYHGGSISPGLQMRYKALYKYTGRLPLITPTEFFPELVGNSTELSIRSGVENGMLEEIKGIINRYRELFDQTDIILTGGDHVKFAGKLKSPIFVAPNLTLNGLKVILDYNDQEYHQ